MPYSISDFDQMNKAQLGAKLVTRKVRNAYDVALAVDKANGDSNIKVTWGPRAVGWGAWECVKSPVTFMFGVFDSKEKLVTKCFAAEEQLAVARNKLKA